MVNLHLVENTTLRILPPIKSFQNKRFLLCSNPSSSPNFAILTASHQVLFQCTKLALLFVPARVKPLASANLPLTTHLIPIPV